MGKRVEEAMEGEMVKEALVPEVVGEMVTEPNRVEDRKWEDSMCQMEI